VLVGTIYRTTAGLPNDALIRWEFNLLTAPHLNN